MAKRLSSAPSIGAGVALFFLVATPAVPKEKTVTLAVDKMTCATCPYTVKQSLTATPGVVSAEVSYKEKTATIVFDDEKTNLQKLIAATTNAGYPSAVKN